MPSVRERELLVESAGRRLLDAISAREPCAPLVDLWPAGTIDDAYAVQQHVLAATKAHTRRVGRKIGLTSPSVQRQMGVTTPDFGVLYADMAYTDRQELPFGQLMQPRVEAEIAFVLKGDLDTPTIIASDVVRATDFVVPAIEVVDSRIANWRISIFDTVADNASSGLFVLGASPRRLHDLPDLGGCEMVLMHEGEPVSTGAGADCLGHPVNAVTWLANTLAERGDPLRAGEVVLSGALGPLVAVQPGATYEARIAGVGSVRATFSN